MPVRRFVRADWFNLRNEIPAILAIIVWPALHRRQIARPVAMPRIDRSRPLQCGGLPRILLRYFTPFPDAVEEVDYQQELEGKRHYSSNCDELVQLIKMGERLECIKSIVTARHTSHANVVHRPEDEVSPNHRTPEMNLPEGLIHEATIHFREPMVNPGKHTEERGDTHYNMEVSHYKVCIVQLDINRRVAQENTC